MGKTNYEEELKKEIEVWEEMKNKYNHLLDLEKPKKKEMAEISLEFYRLSERKPLIEAELKGFQKAKEQFKEKIENFENDVDSDNYIYIETKQRLLSWLGLDKKELSGVNHSQNNLKGNYCEEVGLSSDSLKTHTFEDEEKILDVIKEKVNKATPEELEESMKYLELKEKGLCKNCKYYYHCDTHKCCIYEVIVNNGYEEELPDENTCKKFEVELSGVKE